ncbi:MAG: twin-arginine translocase subunit TatC [Elusimicrobiota bacterium]|jgi:sec-independent protein translocase protein TatC
MPIPPVLEELDIAPLDDPPQSLVSHLIELRRRLIFIFLYLLLGTALCYRWSGDLLSGLARNAGGVIFTYPTEAFMVRLKVALWVGALAALPLMLHQVWLFVARALPPELRRSGKFVVPASYLLFLAGAAAALLLVVPAAMRVLLAFGSDDIRPLMTLSGYLDFVTGMTLAFGGVFQLPVALYLLNRMGWVSRRALAQRRRYAYLLIFIAAALLTPGPDMFTQLALALPAGVVFELTLFLLD